MEKVVSDHRSHADRRLKRLLALLVAMCSGAATRSSAQAATRADIEANPSRPTVTSPATLTPVGYLQFENGALYANTSGEFSTRTGINQVTKLAVVPGLEVILQSEPYVHSVGSVSPGSHVGEIFVGIQGVAVGGEKGRTTLSVSYIRRLRKSLAPEVDIGTFRQSALLLLSGDEWGFHVDANAIFSEQVQEPVRRGQFGQTVSASRVLGKTTISAEIWHFSQPLIKGNAVGNLWATSYQLKPDLVLDGGFDRGLTSSSTHWEVFTGFTYLLPHRLWHPHGPR